MNTDSRYQPMFAALEKSNEIAWIPFIMLGYPNIPASIDIIETFIENGADALEIGIPFSDPVADGVLIQNSARIALEQGATVKKCLEAVATIREKHSEIPIGLLTYANLVFKPGIVNFYQQASHCGIDSVLIADCPLIESKPFINAATQSNIDAVFIAPPNATEATLIKLSEQKGAYTYVVSRPGVTGDAKEVKFPVQVVSSLLENNAPPPILGFGISSPAHVKEAISYGFKGVISGSAITRIISSHTDDKLSAELVRFSHQMKQATLKG